MKTKFNATIEAGVTVVMLHDAGRAQRDQWGLQNLTPAGQVYFDRYASAESGERHVREIVTAAIGMGY